METTTSTTPTAGAATAPDRTANQDLVVGYLERRGLSYELAEDGTAVVPFGDDAGTPTADALLRAGGWAGSGVGVTLRGAAPVPRARWGDALLACNLWNVGRAVPRARLVVEDWEHDAAGVLELDGWLPLGATIDRTVVEGYLDLALSGLAFWTAPTAAPEETP